MPWVSTEGAKTPWRTGTTIAVPVPKELAVLFLTEQLGQSPAKRKVFALVLTDERDETQASDHDLGRWQIEKVHTVREDAGYDQVYALLRRVLP